MDRDDAFYELSKRRSTRRLIDTSLRVYSLFGLIIAIFAGGYFLFTLLPFALSMNQQMSLMIAGVGIALAIMSRALMMFRKESELQKVELIRQYESVASFLDTWTRFEQATKEALAGENEEYSPHSLRSVISQLHEKGKLDASDVVALEEALQARNSIVHGDQPPSVSFAEKITDSLTQIIRKISVP